MLNKPVYRFRSEGAADEIWRVVRGRTREALSETYEAVLEIATSSLAADPDALLGASCVFEMDREGLAAATRRLCGVVHRVEHLGVRVGHQVVRVHVVPALRALAHRTDSRIFQDQTVPQVLAAVLAAGLAPFDRQVRQDGLMRTYPTRGYCVQYRESDLAFCQRLMAEEGIAFGFDHAGDEEVLVLTDGNAAFTPVPTLDEGEVTVVGPELDPPEHESLARFDAARALNTTSVVVRDFDWTRPRLDLTFAARGKDARGRDRESYEYPAALTIGDYHTPAYGRTDERAQAALRREAVTGDAQTASGEGNVMAFAPGLTVEVVGHREAALNRAYVLTAVEHDVEAPEQLIDSTLATAGRPGGAASAPRYVNRFRALPLAVPFRPARGAPSPRVAGVQTATVVGPANEEIYTDEHGRIKVQFHWDREGRRDEGSSCWVRVAQAWAGPGWGALYLPRIGMEVVVDFLEGDPDRPLVTGCVYNGVNGPPYALPEHKTRSTIKSSSSPGGNGFNELRFEDRAGHEEVFVHAQKDLNSHVRNSESRSIGATQSITVGGSRSVTVQHDETIHVHGNRSITVDGQGQGDVDSHTNVTGNYLVHASDTITLDAAHHVLIKAPDTITLQCQGSKIVLTPDHIQLVSGGNATLYLDANALLKASGEGQLYLTANADLKAQGGGQVFLTADANMHGNGGGTVTATADVRLHSASGGDVNVTAGVDANGQNATLALHGTAVLAASAGGTVNLTSDAEVKGGKVKLNA